MKVLLASHGATLMGGAEKSLVALAAGLACRRGIDVLVVVPGDGAMREALIAAGVRVESVPYAWSVRDGIGSSVQHLPAIDRLVTAYAPDVIVTNTSVIPWFGYIAHLRGIPHAWYLREDATADIDIAYHPDVARTLASINAWADRIIVDSRFMKRRYASVLGRRDIHVLYPTFDRSILDHVGPRSRGRGPVRVIVAATIYRAKNQLEALEAIRLLRETHTDVRLTVMGSVASPAYHEELRAFVRRHALARWVRFLPYHDDLFSVLRRHEICIVPSVAEPFGRITVEAMTLKLAVVAADSGGSPEIVGRDGLAGLLYPPGEPAALASHLRALADDPALRERMGERARRVALRRFVETDHVRSFATYLGSLARTRKQRSADWITPEVVDQLFESSVELGLRAAEAAQLSRSVSDIAGQLRDLQQQADGLQSRGEALVLERDRALRLIDEMVGSSSWRFTSPLREVGRRIRAIGAATSPERPEG